MVSLFLLLSLLCSVQNPSAVPNNPTKQTTQSDVKGKAQDKSTDKLLKLTLTAPAKPLRVGDILDMGFKITNISQDTIWLPDMVLGDEVRLSVLDKNGKPFYRQISYGDSKPTVNSITGYSDAMPLTPNYCWGSHTAVKSLKIVLTKPGIYTVKMSLRGTLEQRFYAQSLWQGYIETTQKIYVFPSSSHKEPTTK